jgi:hypothetical protein
MRPAGTLSEGEIASTAAATTAHTTSIHPTLNANMRPHAATAERTSEPGAQDEPQRNQPLTKAIRETVGTRPGESVSVMDKPVEDGTSKGRIADGYSLRIPTDPAGCSDNIRSVIPGYPAT